jgi:hypothetical protein
MHLPVAASSPAPPASRTSDELGAIVEGVALLGVRVTAYTVINLAEHRRREAAGMAAVIKPALLDRLLDLPVAVPVVDPVMWVEMSDQPAGIVERHEDGASIIRRLESPLTIADVVLHATAGKELRAVQDATLFAGFTRRWVTVARSRIPDATMLEAKMYGVGIVNLHHRALLPAEKTVTPTVDGWSWLLAEKAYRRWLSVARAGTHAIQNPVPATDGASAMGAS